MNLPKHVEERFNKIFGGLYKNPSLLDIINLIKK